MDDDDFSCHGDNKEDRKKGTKKGTKKEGGGGGLLFIVHFIDQKLLLLSFVDLCPPASFVLLSNNGFDLVLLIKSVTHSSVNTCLNSPFGYIAAMSPKRPAAERAT